MVPVLVLEGKEWQAGMYKRNVKATAGGMKVSNRKNQQCAQAGRQNA